MLDPRYKNAIFLPSNRASAFNLVVEEMEKVQHVEPNSNSPPVKRTKTLESLNFMEDMLNELDERRKSLEDLGLKKLEDVSRLFIIVLKSNV